ncbi:MAG TPA: ferredoxin [Phycisphaerales bacterium]|nr:ferredoxin [Phycisphaerales bacterium]
MAGKVYRIRGGCVLCETCRIVCPVGAVSIDVDGVHIDPHACIRCGKCLANCPGEAIEAAEEDGPAKEMKGNEE